VAILHANASPWQPNANASPWHPNANASPWHPDANASPFGVAISSDGTIYFTEQGTHRLRMIRDGQVTTVAGSGVVGYADGAALQAQFNFPRGLAISPNGGAIYVADYNNHRIRMIRDGQVTTVAGSGVKGYADGAALQTQFNLPTGLAISPNGGAIYVADQCNHRIRMICDGQVTTVAGSDMQGYADGAALQARFCYPTGLAISPNGGAICVADQTNNRIRMIRDGQVTTVAGSGVGGYADGAALQAQFNIPAALAISPNGDAIYVADQGNNRIRMIRDGQVTTVAGSTSVAGSGVGGYADGAALQAQFNYSTGLAVSPNGGAIYVADYHNKRIRMICVPNVFWLQTSVVDLRQAIDAQPSLFIKIGDVSLGFHECLIAHRCPQLKQVLELTGSSLTIEARAVRVLQSFVYTDTLPDQQKLCSVEWLCLMVWFHMFVIMMNLTGGGCIDAM
jgi:DNA-binding beta-propeller fold protein YncE